MGQRELEEKLNKYAKVVIDFIAPTAIILYGSQAKGTATDNSDIDIAIIVDEINGDILVLEAKLYELSIGIDSRIEPVVFENGADPSGFLRHVRRTGRVLYEKAS
jgi:predicted nucleotidyltransferase